MELKHRFGDSRTSSCREQSQHDTPQTPICDSECKSWWQCLLVNLASMLSETNTISRNKLSINILPTTYIPSQNCNNLHYITLFFPQKCCSFQHTVSLSVSKIYSFLLKLCFHKYFIIYVVIIIILMNTYIYCNKNIRMYNCLHFI